jgi:hypothetical protein
MNIQPATRLSKRVITTMSFMGKCDDKAMQDSVKAYSQALAKTLQQNEDAGIVHRFGEKHADGARKNESNTRTLENTNLRWDRCGAIHKVYRAKPYINKANRHKKNFKNSLEVVTDGGVTAKLFTNGRITGSGYRSEAEFNSFNSALVGGLFPGCTMKTTECCLVHSHAQIALNDGGIDMGRLMTDLERGLPQGATLQERVRQGCILIQFSGPTISVFPDGRVQVVAKSLTDDERMWNCVRSFVVPKCLRCV